MFSQCSPGENLDLLKDKIRDYYQHHYSTEVENICTQTMKHLTTQYSKFTPNDLVIFDIDDTIFSTYPFYEQRDFSRFKHPADLSLSILPPIQSVIDLYFYILTLGLNVILMTGRNEMFREHTTNELAKYNIIAKTSYNNGYLKLIMRENENNEPGSSLKFRHRKSLSSKYRIVANIGDQCSDFEGGYNGYIVKLPNYLYYIK